YRNRTTLAAGFGPWPPYPARRFSLNRETALMPRSDPILSGRLNTMEVIYRYDGSFEGFLCCVFDSYVNKEIPWEFQDESHLAQSLFPVRWIGTDLRHAQRILVSLEKIDPWAKELVVKG